MKSQRDAFLPENREVDPIRLNQNLKEDKINIIYILSNGRSGSTILDLILGGFDNVFTCGEVQLLELENNIGAKCGDGQEISKSAFWGAIVDRHKFKEEKMTLGYFRKTDKIKKSHTGKVIRIGLLADWLLGFGKNRDKITSYGKINKKLFQLIKDQAIKKDILLSEPHYLVDSSKDPYRLLWLQKSEFFNIKVIHLVKHPCSFVFSTSRRDNEGIHLLLFLRMILRWIIENRIMRSVCKRSLVDGSYYLMRYEDLARNTEDAIDKCIDHLGIDLKGNEYSNIRTYQNFGISGNLARWENKPIRLDERWKKQMPILFRWMCKCLTFPFSSFYRNHR